MSQLKKLIEEEFGAIVLGMFDPFQDGLSFPLDEQSFRYVVANVDTIFNGPSGRDLSSLVEKILEEKIKYATKDDVLLASRIFGHDLMKLHIKFGHTLENISIIPGRLDSPEFISSNLAFLTQFRLLGLSAVYLATGGDDRFLTHLPSSQVEYLLRQKTTHPFTNKTKTQGTIKNPEFSAFYQVAGNARSDFTFEYNEQENYGTIHFQDYGTGILNLDKKPLPPERIHEIFREFSTKVSGGFGLHFSKRLLELRGGYIEVVSSHEGVPSIKYSTRTEQFVLLPPEARGTQFTLYFPKVS